MGSSATDPNDTVQFRLRVNQRDSWQAWSRIVASYNGQAPSTSNDKTYNVFFDPKVMGTTDDLAIFSVDIMSFDPADATDSWLYLESMKLEEITLNP